MSGYFKVERDFLDSDFWLSEAFTKAQAWVDLFGIANHASGFFIKRGIKISLQRSQIGRSELTFSKRWKWSRNKVRRFLKWLEKEKMITLKQDNKTSIITICNYNVYQRKIPDDETPNDTPNDTPKRHQKDTKRNTNNNVENVNNVEKKILTSKKVFDGESREMKICKYFFAVLQKSRPEQNEPNWQTWCKDIDLFLRKMNPTNEEIRTVINYAHDPANATDKFSWIPNLRSPKKLREHFEQILLQSKSDKRLAVDDGSKAAAARKQRTQELLKENE